MNLLDRYLLREWLQVFVMCLLLVVGVLLLQQVYNDLPDFLEAGAGAGVILRYFLTLIPSFIPTLVPLGTLVAVLFVVGSFHRNQELVAIRAAGVGIFRFSAALWIAAGVLTALLVWLGASVVPQTQESARQQLLALERSRADADSSRAPGLETNVALAHPGTGELWFFNQLDTFAGVATGISVHRLDANHRERERIIADRGRWDGGLQSWILEDVRRIRRAPGGIEIVAEEPFRSMRVEANGVTPRVLAALQEKPQDLSLFQLRDVLAAFGDENHPRVRAFAVYYYRRIAEPFACLVAVAFAVPFAAAGVRRNPLVSTARAMGAFLLYMIGARFLAILAERGGIEPVLAAWLPAAIALTVGIRMFFRGR